MASFRPETAMHLAILGDEESVEAFARRLRAASGPTIAFLGAREKMVASSIESQEAFIEAVLASKSYIATKNGTLSKHARAKGIRVIDRTADLKDMLGAHPQAQEALRLFSPHVWRQQLKSQLQRMGLIAMPRLRIYSLVAISSLLLFFVVFRLLPSADITVKPRQEAVTQTVNVFLVQSGAQLPASRVRTLPLRVFEIRDRRTVTFDQISKEFIGSAASVDLDIRSTAAEEYSLKKGTRFQNQAGMVFRTLASVTVPAGGTAEMRAKADDVDAFGQIIGSRGNVPAGVTWDVPGLPPEERSFITAVNPVAGSGGTTGYRTVLSAEDVEIATKRLEQELLAGAKTHIEEEIAFSNAEHPEWGTRLLRYGELTKLAFTGFVLPTQFVGQEVTSVPVEGGIVYTAYGYDALSILEFLQSELLSHVREGKRLLTEDVTDESLIVHVIDYADDLSWIKLTVDLSALEEYVLDPLTKDGALFARTVREDIAGRSVDDALRIIRNMPEVEKAHISIWPPWKRTLPDIPAHISITADE